VPKRFRSPDEAAAPRGTPDGAADRIQDRPPGAVPGRHPGRVHRCVAGRRAAVRSAGRGALRLRPAAPGAAPPLRLRLPLRARLGTTAEAMLCTAEHRVAVLLEVSVLGAYIRFEQGFRYARQRVRTATVGPCACGAVAAALADAGWGRPGWRGLAASCAGCVRGRTAVSLAGFARLAGDGLRVRAGSGVVRGRVTACPPGSGCPNSSPRRHCCRPGWTGSRPGWHVSTSAAPDRGDSGSAGYSGVPDERRGRRDRNHGPAAGRAALGR
jgi:hypothetical protein